MSYKIGNKVRRKKEYQCFDWKWGDKICVVTGVNSTNTVLRFKKLEWGWDADKFEDAMTLDEKIKEAEEKLRLLKEQKGKEGYLADVERLYTKLKNIAPPSPGVTEYHTGTYYKFTVTRC